MRAAGLAEPQHPVDGLGGLQDPRLAINHPTPLGTTCCLWEGLSPAGRVTWGGPQWGEHRGQGAARGAGAAPPPPSSLGLGAPAASYASYPSRGFAP